MSLNLYMFTPPSLRRKSREHEQNSMARQDNGTPYNSILSSIMDGTIYISIKKRRTHTDELNIGRPLVVIMHNPQNKGTRGLAVWSRGDDRTNSDSGGRVQHATSMCESHALFGTPFKSQQNYTVDLSQASRQLPGIVNNMSRHTRRQTQRTMTMESPVWVPTSHFETICQCLLLIKAGWLSAQLQENTLKTSAL